MGLAEGEVGNGSPAAHKTPGWMQAGPLLAGRGNVGHQLSSPIPVGPGVFTLVTKPCPSVLTFLFFRSSPLWPFSLPQSQKQEKPTACNDSSSSPQDLSENCPDSAGSQRRGAGRRAVTSP